jgi:hypothetical protein
MFFFQRDETQYLEHRNHEGAIEEELLNGDPRHCSVRSSELPVRETVTAAPRGAVARSVRELKV